MKRGTEKEEEKLEAEEKAREEESRGSGDQEEERGGRAVAGEERLQQVEKGLKREEEERLKKNGPEQTRQIEELWKKLSRSRRRLLRLRLLRSFPKAKRAAKFQRASLLTAKTTVVQMSPSYPTLTAPSHAFTERPSFSVSLFVKVPTATGRSCNARVVPSCSPPPS